MSDIDGFKDLFLEKEYLQGKTREKAAIYHIIKSSSGIKKIFSHKMYLFLP
jgi:hypothetical protein